MSNEDHPRSSTFSTSPSSTRPALAPQSTPTPFRFTPTATATAAAAATTSPSPANTSHLTRKTSYESAAWTQFSRKPRFHSSSTPAVASPASDHAVPLAATAVVVDDEHDKPISPEHKRRRKLPHTPEKNRPREPARTTASSFKPPPRFLSSSSSFSSALSTPTAASTQTPTFRFTSLSAAAAAASASVATADGARSEEPLLLSTIFSPRKSKSHSRFIKGGIAEQVRSWVVDASSSDALSFLPSAFGAGTSSSSISSKAGPVQSRTHAGRGKESGRGEVVLRVAQCFNQHQGKEQATDSFFCRCTIFPGESLEIEDGDGENDGGNEEELVKEQGEETLNILLIGGGGAAGGTETLSSLSTRTLQEGSRIVLDRDTLGWTFTLTSPSTLARSALLSTGEQEAEGMDEEETDNEEVEGGGEGEGEAKKREEEWIVCAHGWHILASTSSLELAGMNK